MTYGFGWVRDSLFISIPIVSLFLRSPLMIHLYMYGNLGRFIATSDREDRISDGFPQFECNQWSSSYCSPFGWQ